MELTFFDIIPAPALRFRSRTMLHSITMNSSSCLGWHKLLKGWLQKVFPSISATKNKHRTLKNRRNEVFQKSTNVITRKKLVYMNWETSGQQEPQLATHSLGSSFIPINQPQTSHSTRELSAVKQIVSDYYNQNTTELRAFLI